MSGQIAGDPAAIAGHVPEAAGGEAQQRRLGVSGLGRESHQGGGGEVRHVGDHRHELVVAIGRERHQVGAEAADDRLDPGEGGRVGQRRRREHPGRADEQLRVGSVGALLLRPGHRVAADEARVCDGAATIGAFTPPTSVTTSSPDRSSRSRLVTSPAMADDRRRHECDAGEVVDTELVDRSELVGALGSGLVEVVPGDLPPPRA